MAKNVGDVPMKARWTETVWEAAVWMVLAVVIATVMTSRGAKRKTIEVKTFALPGGERMEMVWCPPGTFTMGSPEKERGREKDETLHRVTLTKGFWIAKTEVTQKQWKSVMGNNPAMHKGEPDCPVENVSWMDCMEFCQKTGLELPTEAEWEYACRAGSPEPYAGTGKLNEMGWYYCRDTHPVGKKRANTWGVHDMHGNVQEWCADWYGDYPSGSVETPMGADSGQYRVCRGGHVKNMSKECRSANRNCYSAETQDPFVGFRPVFRQK